MIFPKTKQLLKNYLLIQNFKLFRLVCNYIVDQDKSDNKNHWISQTSRWHFFSIFSFFCHPAIHTHRTCHTNGWNIHKLFTAPLAIVCNIFAKPQPLSDEELTTASCHYQVWSFLISFWWPWPTFDPRYFHKMLPDFNNFSS